MEGRKMKRCSGVKHFYDFTLFAQTYPQANDEAKEKI
jgi:hypothetical protein